MNSRFLLIAAIFLSICSGCDYKREIADKRDAMLAEIEAQNAELQKIFDTEINLRNELNLFEDPNLMIKQKYVNSIQSHISQRIKAETALAEKLQKYYRKFSDEKSYSKVLELYISPKIEIIHDLKRFQAEITRKQILSEMLEEFKKGNVQEREILRALEDFKKEKITTYSKHSSIEIESEILFNEVFTKQYSIIEEFIGEYLSALQKYFSDFEEVREIDNEIVRPYYKRLISSLPANNKKLSAEEKKILHKHLEKIIKLFPYSNLTVKAERKLIPLTAKKGLSELNGVPLIFFLVILLGITVGYTLCLRGFLRHKQPENSESKIFKPIGTQQISSIDSDFNTQFRLHQED